MAFETSSYASSSPLEAVDAPKELLLVLSNLNEKQQQQHRYHHHHQQQQQQEQQQQSQQHMELSQIELIYRAEGNANLVLALPQFKKVLRLPKIQQKHQQQQQQQQRPQYQETQYNQKHSEQHQQEQQQQNKQQQNEKQQHAMNQQEPNKILTTGQQQTKNAVGILTMDHYVAYISIIRCLVGNEFVFEADIVAVPNPNDRDWINEHIKPYRPANRLDKEFGGHFGLLLPDATQLPAEFDILFSNLQSTTSTATQTGQCWCCTNNIFGADTYAIEIKPKQGWLLPNDVNNLFDIKPTTAAATTTEAASTAESETLKISTDKECFTATQNLPSQTITMPAITTTTTSTTPTMPATSEIASDCSSMSAAAAAAARDDKISHSLYDKVDIRCRYCSMQFLKLKQQKINKRNHYCPIDLFSGVTERMFSALHALFLCPQNNLRIFKNGTLIFDDQLSRTSKIEDLFPSDKLQLIKHLLVTCLLREYGKTETECASEDVEVKQRGNKETEQRKHGDAAAADDGSVGDGQPQSSVTPCKKQKINTLRTTAIMETEVTKVKTTLATTIPTSSAINTLTRPTTATYSAVSVKQINKAEVPCLPKNCVLQKILHLQLLAKINMQYMLDHEYALKSEKTYCVLHKLLKKFEENHNELKLSQLLPEEQYLLAATALDCSIMITFCEMENVEEKSLLNNPYVVTVCGKKFLTKVMLLDLDPKPDTHFAKYCQQTKDIVSVLNQF